MQDKELDRLFKSGLEDFAVEPTSGVWNKVVTELDKKQGKRPFMLYLSIAASILLLLSAGLYFVSQNKGTVKSSVQLSSHKNNKPVKTVITPASVKPDTDARPLMAKVLVKLYEHKVKPVLKAETPVKTVIEKEVAEPVTALAFNEAKPVKILNAVVPGKEIALSAKTELLTDTPFFTKATSLTMQVPSVVDNRTMAAAPVRKHRIRNLGDLINVVVSKVDKRKDKLIEFSDTDEDESKVTGLNLGFIKIKKQD